MSGRHPRETKRDGGTGAEGCAKVGEVSGLAVVVATSVSLLSRRETTADSGTDGGERLGDMRKMPTGYDHDRPVGSQG